MWIIRNSNDQKKRQLEQEEKIERKKALGSNLRAKILPIRLSMPDGPRQPNGDQLGFDSRSEQRSWPVGLAVLFKFEYLRSTLSPGLFPREYPGQENYEKLLFSSIFIINFSLCLLMSS